MPAATIVKIDPDFTDLPVRFSLLKAYGRSALHGRHARLTEMKQTAAMLRGTAVDAIIFGTRRVIYYNGKRDPRSKDYQAFMEANPDAEILTVKDYDEVMEAVEALRNCEHLKPWMGQYTQQTLMFDYMGRRCRATPDWRGDGFVNDLKYTNDASEYRFPWHARRMGWPVQVFMQGIAAEANGFPIQRHLITAAESARPFPITIFELTDRAKDKAARILMQWMERLKNAEDSKEFPGYSQAIVALDEEEDVELVYGTDDETTSGES